MKKTIIIVIVIAILLIGGYVAYTKFFPSLPKGSRTDLEAKVKELEYKLLLAQKSGADTKSIEMEIAKYKLALEKSSFEGVVYYA